jgi:hypothetical protein
MKLFLKHPVIFVAVWWNLKVSEGNEYISQFKNDLKGNLFGKK